MNGSDLTCPATIPVFDSWGPKCRLQQTLQIIIDSNVNVPICFFRLHAHLNLVIHSHSVPYNNCGDCEGPAKVCGGDDIFSTKLFQRQKSRGKVGRDFVGGGRDVLAKALAEAGRYVFGDVVDMTINQ
jgi:hypothetical protein